MPVGIVKGGNAMVVPVIITYNFLDDFYERTAHLLSQYEHGVIVDNCSQPDCKRDLYRLKEQFPGLSLIENSDNLGIAGALNQGCRQALDLGADWVLTLDQDSEVSENMVETMLLAYEALPEDVREKCVSLFPTYQDRNLLQGQKVVSDPADVSSTQVVVEITSGNLLRHDVFEKVGYFDEGALLCLGSINLLLTSESLDNQILSHQ